MYNKLIELCRNENRKGGYQEVMSPQMLSSELFKLSGHMEHYEDDMFVWSQQDGRQVALKPIAV